jgi:hypothetical protein
MPKRPNRHQRSLNFAAGKTKNQEPGTAAPGGYFNSNCHPPQADQALRMLRSGLPSSIFAAGTPTTSAAIFNLPPPPAAVLEFNIQHSTFNIPPAAAGTVASGFKVDTRLYGDQS